MLARAATLAPRAAPLAAAGRRALSASIDMSRLRVERTPAPKAHQPKEELLFGQSFSDHMLDLDWTKQDGWADPVIRPYGPLDLDPAASSLHYALQCFEGMKAYLDADDQIRLFRPEKNMERMEESMNRLAMPFDKEGVLAGIKELLRVDRDWIPRGDGYSLYLRPTGIATHPALGVAPAESCKVFCIMSPVGPYYPQGFAPVQLYADTENVRAWPGGTGHQKVGGNYGPSIQPMVSAVQKGYSQVLWLFGEDHTITEVGTMNLFIGLRHPDGRHELVTAPLSRHDILPGVTRLSVLELAREWGDYDVQERFVTMAELVQALEEGRVTEIFGTGTAAIVSSVDKIGYQGVDYSVPLDPDNPEAGAGKIAQRVWKELTDIQYGRVESPWSVVV